MMSRIALIVSITLVLAACASASQGSGSARCALTAADSVYLKRGPVYRDCAVDKHVQIVSRSPLPDFRPDASPPRELCYSAEVEFVVDVAGNPEPDEARIVRANNPSFGDAVLAAVVKWRYQPAVLGGVPVRQIVREKLGVTTTIVRAGDIPRPPSHAAPC